MSYAITLIYENIYFEINECLGYTSTGRLFHLSLVIHTRWLRIHFLSRKWKWTLVPKWNHGWGHSHAPCAIVDNLSCTHLFVCWPALNVLLNISFPTIYLKYFPQRSYQHFVVLYGYKYHSTLTWCTLVDFFIHVNWESSFPHNYLLLFYL